MYPGGSNGNAARSAGSSLADDDEDVDGRRSWDGTSGDACGERRDGETDWIAEPGYEKFVRPNIATI